jgi:hypothetical protein
LSEGHPRPGRREQPNCRLLIDAFKESRMKERNPRIINSTMGMGAHLTFVGDFAAKQRLAKRKEGAIACLYDFAPHDFA